jgi:signal transduction histidine kinase/DNA-binding response OmpR family regulator
MSTAESSDLIQRPTKPPMPTGQGALAEKSTAECSEAQRCRRVALFCCAIGALIALATLLAYALTGLLDDERWMVLAGQYTIESDTLVLPQPNTLGPLKVVLRPKIKCHPMVPDAALSLLTLTSAVFMYARNRRSGPSRVFAVGAALLVFLWVLVKLIGFVTGRVPTQSGTARLVMSPIAEVSLLVAALVLVLLVWDHSTRLLHVAGALTSLVVLINLVAVISYLDGHPLFYGEFGNKDAWPTLHGILWNPVAVNAAVGYLCLSLSLIYTAGWDHFPLRPLRGLSPRVLILRCLPVACVVAIGFLYFQRCIFLWFDGFTSPPSYELLRALGVVVFPAIILGLAAWSAGGTINRAQVERQQAIDQLAQAKTAAEKASRVKGEFLANMSHELRTPLAIIKLQAEELQEQAEEQGDKDLLAALQTILDASERQGKLIDGILDLGKVESGKLELSPVTIDLAALLEAVAADIRPLAVRNGNVLQVLAPERPGSMYADPLRLRQCLDNVLNNACKFTQKGTITLRLERETVDGKDWISFHVSDTGIGMSPLEQQKLFQAFTQGEPSTARKFGGTGLGLVISRNLCRRMGGDLSVVSAKGAGSTFTLRLPAEGRIRKPEHLLADAKKAPGPVAPASRPMILVIDDEPVVQELLVRFLSKEGFHVVSAGNGEEGLRLAREVHPEAVTLDVLLPGMDGWTVLLEMKTDPDLASIPVIMLTIVDDKSQGYTLGASDYLTKPVDRQQLLSVLQKHCGVAAPGHALLVEDDVPIRGLLRRGLEGAGWSVAEAGNGREALEQLTRARPDVILLDLLMPEMDGFEFIQALRRQEQWQAIPVVVLTAKDLTAEDRQQLNGQVSRILKKDSYGCDELLRQVSRFLAIHVGREPTARAVGASESPAGAG